MPTRTTRPRRNVALAAAVAADERHGYEIAAASKVNPTLFSRVVHGRHEPSPDMRARIAKALGVAEDEIFPEAT